MLVFHRMREQQVIINFGTKQVVLTVTDAGRGHCKLGFEAPKEVQIDRREIWELKQRKEQDAA